MNFLSFSVLLDFVLSWAPVSGWKLVIISVLQSCSSRSCSELDLDGQRPQVSFRRNPCTVERRGQQEYRTDFRVRVEANSGICLSNCMAVRRLP